MYKKSLKPTANTGLECKINFWICACVSWNSQRFYVVRNWYQLLVLNISGSIKLGKSRKLFSSSDFWSPEAGFFPIETNKLLRYCRKEYLYKKCIFCFRCITKSCENCVLHLTNIWTISHTYKIHIGEQMF